MIFLPFTAKCTTDLKLPQAETHSDLQTAEEKDKDDIQKKKQKKLLSAITNIVVEILNFLRDKKLFHNLSNYSEYIQYVKNKKKMHRKVGLLEE